MSVIDENRRRGDVQLSSYRLRSACQDSDAARREYPSY